MLSSLSPCIEGDGDLEARHRERGNLEAVEGTVDPPLFEPSTPSFEGAPPAPESGGEEAPHQLPQVAFETVGRAHARKHGPSGFKVTSVSLEAETKTVMILPQVHLR